MFVPVGGSQRPLLAGFPYEGLSRGSGAYSKVSSPTRTTEARSCYLAAGSTASTPRSCANCGLLKTNADGRTLIVASHAASVFNSLEPENLRLVAMVAGQTKVRSLKAQEIDTARKFMSSDGTLAEFMELME